MPASRSASSAPSATLGCGRVPAEIARTAGPRSWFTSAWAIWLRQEFPVHRIRTVFLSLMLSLSTLAAGATTAAAGALAGEPPLNRGPSRHPARMDQLAIHDHRGSRHHPVSQDLRHVLHLLQGDLHPLCLGGLVDQLGG